MAIQMAKVSFTIRGISPLLSDNPRGMLVPAQPGPGPIHKPDIHPDMQAESRTYRDADGNLCIPTAAPRKALIEAAKVYKIGRSNAQSMVTHIQVEPEELTVLCDPDTGLPLVAYEVDVRRGVNPNTKQGIVVIRPRFNRWQTTFSVLYDPSLVQFKGMTAEDGLAYLLEVAGSRIGIMPFRPERKGWFGRFEVV